MIEKRFHVFSVLAKQKYFINNGEAFAIITWSILICHFHVEWRGGEGRSMQVCCHHILSNLNVVWVTIMRSHNNKITSPKHENLWQGLNNKNMPPWREKKYGNLRCTWTYCHNKYFQIPWMKVSFQFWYGEMVKSPSSTFDIHVLHHPIANSCSSEYIFMWRVSKLLSSGGSTPTSPTHGKPALRMSDYYGIRFWVHPASLVHATIIEVLSTNHVGTMGAL